MFLSRYLYLFCFLMIGSLFLSLSLPLSLSLLPKGSIFHQAHMPELTKRYKKCATNSFCSSRRGTHTPWGRSQARIFLADSVTKGKLGTKKDISSLSSHNWSWEPVLTIYSLACSVSEVQIPLNESYSNRLIEIHHVRLSVVSESIAQHSSPPELLDT